MVLQQQGVPRLSPTRQIVTIGLNPGIASMVTSAPSRTTQPRKVRVEVAQLPEKRAKVKGRARVKNVVIHPAQGDLEAEKDHREGAETIALRATEGQLLLPTGSLSAAPPPVGKRIAKFVLST